jgi:hypothetical protein
MRKSRKRRKKYSASTTNLFVRKHLPVISRALLEGENKEKFAAFLKDHEKHGLIAVRLRHKVLAASSSCAMS